MIPTLICEDAFVWLNNKTDNSLDTIITGIPDLDELEELNSNQVSLEEYTLFFKKAVNLIMKKVRDDECIILIQTDRKIKGEWIDKSYLSNTVANELELKLLWHKIIQNREGTYLQRPTYSHLLAYSKKQKSGKAFPDVISCGKKLYKNATSPNAVWYVMNFLKEKNIKSIIDPFTGRGTIPYIASLFDIHSIGIDIDPKQIEYSKNINKKIITI
jgi:hypothetical protein